MIQILLNQFIGMKKFRIFLISKLLSIAILSFADAFPVSRKFAYTVDISTAYKKVLLPRACKCRLLCIETRNECSFYSMVKNRDSWMCHLFNHETQHFLKSDLESLMGTIAMVPENATLEKDGQFYFIHDKVANFDESRNVCSNYPGFHLALIKTTDQKDIAFQKQSSLPFTGFMDTILAIDMRKTPNGIMLGDGTLYKDTSLAQTYTPITNSHEENEDQYFIRANDINDYRPDYPMYLLCQSNLLGMKNIN